MKKIQLVLTLLAFMLAGAGVFATSNAPVTIDQRIDSSDPDSVCDQQVTSECDVPSGQDCRYNAGGGVMKTVHDYQSGNCQLLFKN